MTALLTALALLLHVALWGAGAAMLATPRPWLRFWPVLVLPLGLTLQSVIVWAGAWAGLPGTDAYARVSLLVPLLLLAAGLRRVGWRLATADLRRVRAVAAVTVGGLLLLASPLVMMGGRPTTVSLGSCDAADYAAGARVLQEFARSDRSGFLGLTEVVRVQSVDNFPDYWLRLNHFTPSALIALNGSVLGLAPHELTTLVTALALAGIVPLVFWLARATFGFGGLISLALAVLSAVNPVLWYAVAHVAPGQLLAAQACALFAWAGVALWRGRLTWRRAAAFLPLLAAGYALVLGSYNFLLLVCLAPPAALAFFSALRTARWTRFGGWLAAMLAPLVVSGVLFAERVAGLAERLSLLRTYDFGWPIPALTPEGWFGLVLAPDLEPLPWPLLRWALAALFAGLLVYVHARGAAWRTPAGWLALVLPAPVLAGYAFLQVRGAWLGTNASYDAYKLFAVFLPVLLPACARCIVLLRSGGLGERRLVMAAVALVVMGNLTACGGFIARLGNAPLRVAPDLVALRRIEAMDDVRAVNLIVPDMWSRLWAHVFLLRKGQYFATHTYEARRDTPLRGDWTLEGGVVGADPGGDGRRVLSNRFSLVRATGPGGLRVTQADGWHGLESATGSGDRWEWTGREAVLVLENPRGRPLQATLKLDARAHGARQVELVDAAGERIGAPVRLGETRTVVDLGPITLPPGTSRWMLRSLEPTLRASPTDPRMIALCVHRLRVEAGGN
jgi:hypothetical protein